MKKPRRPFELEEEDKGSSNVVGIDFDDDPEDEEIIDLEDIVELDEEVLEEEDQFDLDVELLDAESDMDLNDLDRPASTDVDDVLEDDFLKEFSLADEKASKAGLLDEPDLGKDSEEEDFESLLRFDEDISIDTEKKDKSPIAEEARIPGFEMPLDATGFESAALDDVVSRMEVRLVETIREIVESRLPEIVRSVLREEIERLKNEIK